jgi:type III pantothenate kinase
MAKKNEKMLAIDIGNSTISFGFFNGENLISSKYLKKNASPNKISKLMQSGRIYLNNCIISSVVPHLTVKVIKSIRSVNRFSNILIIGKDIKIDIPSQYDKKKVGIDRLVNAYGALKLYQLPIVIADFGTAITFDYISKKGVFAGGLIVPGVETSSDGLARQAPLLPKLGNIGRTTQLLGRDTKIALQSGLLNGFGALADGLIERIWAEEGKCKALATGGFAAKLAPYTKRFDYIDPYHTLRSITMIYQDKARVKECQ